MKLVCPRCELCPLWPNEDGDPSCFICGFALVAVPAWLAEVSAEDANTPRRRRPRRSGPRRKGVLL